VSISTLHKLDLLAFPSSVYIKQIRNQRIAAGIDLMQEKPAGHLHDMFVANQRTRPMIEFSTPQIATVLGLAGVAGAAPGGAVTAYLKRAAQVGNVARVTTSHKKIVVNSSLLYWQQIRLPHNGVGEVQCTLCAQYDGTNAPYVYTGSVALASTLSASEYFGAGPVTINGTSIPGVQEITIQSGVQLMQEGGESEEYDTFVGTEQTNVIVTIQTKEVVNWSTLGLAGIALDGTAGLIFFGRAYKANDSRYSDASSNHIKGQALLGKAVPVDTSGDGGGTVSDTLQVVCVASSDSVLPIVFTTATTID